MPIHRVEHDKRFTIIDNGLLRSKMSMQAIGLLSFMLSCSDTYEFSERGLCESFSNGRDAIRTALRELEANGYLHREQRRVDGKYSEWEWDVYEKPWLDFPTSVNPPKEVPTERIELNGFAPSNDERDATRCSEVVIECESIERECDSVARAHEGAKEAEKRPDFSKLEPLPGPTEQEVYDFLNANSDEFFGIMVCGTWLSWYDAQAGRGWRDRHGNAIRSWRQMLRGFNAKYMSDMERGIRTGSISRRGRKVTQTDVARSRWYGKRIARLAS